MVFDVHTGLPNIFFPVAAVVDTGVPWGAGQLVVGSCGSSRGTSLSPWWLGPGHWPEVADCTSPMGGFGKGAIKQQSAQVLRAESRNIFIGG